MLTRTARRAALRGKRALPGRTSGRVLPRRVLKGAPVAALVAVAASVGALQPFASSSSAAPTAETRAFEEALPPPVPSVRPVEPTRIAGPGTPAGDSRIIDLVVGDEERAYFLLPALSLPRDEPAALLVVLHQDVGSAREMSVRLGLDDLRKEGITLAYPAGIGGSWNAGACCGIARTRGVDDVGFVNAVLDDVGRHTRIDPDRRALLGYSGGGMLAYKLLCEDHPPLVAAVEINGSLETPCAPTLDMPDLLSVHGEKDGSIGLTASRHVSHLKMSPRSVTATLTDVTTLAGCGPRTETEANGIDLWTWADCRGGSSVQAQIVPGAGHGWADVGGAARATGFLLPRLAARR